MVSIKDKRLSERDKGRKRMSDVLSAKRLFEEAFPEKRFGSVKEMLNEGFRFLSSRVNKAFTHRRVRSIWEGAAKRIDGEEMDALREAVFEENRREQRELRARLAALDALFATQDEKLHRKQAEAIRP